MTVRAATHGHQIDIVRFGNAPIGIQFVQDESVFYSLASYTYRLSLSPHGRQL